MIPLTSSQQERVVSANDPLVPQAYPRRMHTRLVRFSSATILPNTTVPNTAPKSGKTELALLTEQDAASEVPIKNGILVCSPSDQGE